MGLWRFDPPGACENTVRATVMSLNDQLNSFKSKIRNAPSVVQKRTVAGTSQDEDRDAKKPKVSSRMGTPSSFVAPAMTPAAVAASSTHKSTLLFHAVEYIKKQEREVKFSEIESYLSTPIESLLGILRGIDRIRINDRNRTARYVSVYNIYSAPELLTYLRSQPNFRGTPVNKLKDGWNGCVAAVEELDRKQEVIVLRNKKDKSPQYVWANVGGKIGQIDQEYVNLWVRAKVPEASELPGLLTKANLKPTSVDPATIKKAARPASEQRKQKKPRRAKITNTHLQGVLKDYGL